MKIKRFYNPYLPLPSRSTDGSAGYDLRSNMNTFTIEPGQRVLVDTGFCWEIPQGMVGQIRPRSGLAVKYGIHTMAGIIDSDYRGEVKVLLVNLSDTAFEVTQGERIAQMLVTSYLGEDLEEVDDLDDTSRGKGGFGHTGRD